MKALAWGSQPIWSMWPGLRHFCPFLSFGSKVVLRLSRVDRLPVLVVQECGVGNHLELLFAQLLLHFHTRVCEVVCVSKPTLIFGIIVGQGRGYEESIPDLPAIPSSDTAVLMAFIVMVSGELDHLLVKNDNLLSLVRIPLFLNFPETLNVLLEDCHCLILVEVVIVKIQMHP